MIELLLNCGRLYAPDRSATPQYEYVGHGVRVLRLTRHPRSAWPHVSPTRLDLSVDPAEFLPDTSEPFAPWRQTALWTPIDPATFLQRVASAPRRDYPLEPCRCGERRILRSHRADDTALACVCDLDAVRSACRSAVAPLQLAPKLPTVDGALLRALLEDEFLQVDASEHPSVIVGGRGPALVVAIQHGGRASTAATLPAVK